MDIEEMFDRLKRDAEFLRETQPELDEATKKTLDWLANGMEND